MIKSYIVLLILCSLAFRQAAIGGKSGLGGKAGIGSGASSGATPTLLTHCVASGTGTCTINSTGASLIVVAAIAGGLNAVTIFTENKGNTIHTPAAAAFVVGSTNGAGQIYYIFSPTVGSGHIFTGGAAQNCYFVSSWSNMLASSSVYDTGNGHGQFGGSTTFQPGSVTPSGTNELLVSMALNDDNGTVWTIPTSFTLIDNSTCFAAESSAYYVDPSSSAINPTWTNSASPNGGTVIAVFKHQ